MTQTMTDIAELVIEIAFAANIPLLLAAMIIIKLSKMRLDEYCEGIE